MLSNLCPDPVSIGVVSTESRFRIGELSRRSGVSPDLLRAWERRYGLLRPSRSSGGLRLYSEDDVLRVQAMQEQLAAGLAAAEAAAVASSRQGNPQGSVDTMQARDELDAALLAYDEGAAHATFDALVARFSLETVLADVVLPYLHDVGDRWERSEISVAQEHFASAFLRGRLLGLARGWGQGFGPTALLACAPGEQHDLGLVAFGLALRSRGWRILYLGPDTPLESLADAARSSRPDRVVVSAVDPTALEAGRDNLGDLARNFPLAVGGAAATGVHLGDNVLILAGSPTEEAENLTRLERTSSTSRVLRQTSRARP
jgi:DNA-binding transcriptional MerR regulator